MNPIDRIFRLADAKYPEQRDFAKAIGVTPSIVSQWRNGTTKSYVKRLEKISAALGTTPNYILTGEENGDPTTDSDDEAALDRELISRLVQLTPEELERWTLLFKGF